MSIKRNIKGVVDVRYVLRLHESIILTQGNRNDIQARKITEIRERNGRENEIKKSKER